jgi:fermentation-respiration switch protein FrsA (DUF1100 family)
VTTAPPKPPLARRAWAAVRRRVVPYGLLYVAVVAVFLWFENALVFRACTASESWLEPRGMTVRDVRFRSADGTELHAWWIPPERPDAGAVLVSHGNGGNLSYRGFLAGNLSMLTGAGVLLYDYPGYGHSAGTPSEAGCYAAADAAYDWLTTTGKVPPGRVVLVGESLGGGVAVDLAARTEHRALVLFCTFTTLPAAAKARYPFLPTHTMMRNRFDSLSKIDRCRRPLFLAHGTADGSVPVRLGEELFAAAPGPKEFLRVEGAGHNDLLSERVYLALKAFLDRHPAE